MKKASIDWDTFLSAVRRFPYLQQVAIQCTNLSSDDPSRMLVEFVSHLGEAWTSLGSLLGLYHGTSTRRQGIRCCIWVEIQLDTMMDEIKRKVCVLALPDYSANTQFFENIREKK